MIRICSIIAVVSSLVLCACTTDSHPTNRQEDVAYEKKEFKPRVDQVLNESLPEAEKIRAQVDATPTAKAAH